MLIAVFALAVTAGACSKKSSDTASPGASSQAASGDGSGGSGAQAGGTSVTVKSFAFRPQILNVKSGTTVTWTNNDQILHTVTSGADGKHKTGLFDGQLPDAGKTFSFKFSKPGTYDYFCSRHDVASTMHGKIIVT